MEWKEITYDNCDTIYELDSQDYPIMIAHKLNNNFITYHDLHNVSSSISTMVKCGGFYYIVLPKLY